MDDNKIKALNFAITQIEKNYGKGSIMKLGELPKIQLNTISSGALSIDLALGIGGYPRGRIIEIYGPEASGKTTLSLHAVAEAQKKGGTCAYIDVENALDASYAKKIGVNIDELLLSQPDYGEQALEIVETLVRSGAVDVIVIDSVAALVPKAEIEGEMIDVQMGLQARLMSKALRKLTAIVNKSKTIVIFVNQVREKIGFVLGNPEVTSGGRALKFYSSVRIEVRRTQSLKSGVDIIGNKTRIKIVKNKVAPPFKQTEVEIIFGQGISSIGDALDLATEFEIIEKSGTWYSYQNERLGQGREAAKTHLEQNPKILDKLIVQIKEKANLIKQEKKEN
jgi:recombination protein RecA